MYKTGGRLASGANKTAEVWSNTWPYNRRDSSVRKKGRFGLDQGPGVKCACEAFLLAYWLVLGSGMVEERGVNKLIELGEELRTFIHRVTLSGGATERDCWLRSRAR